MDIPRSNWGLLSVGKDLFKSHTRLTGRLVVINVEWSEDFSLHVVSVSTPFPTLNTGLPHQFLLS